VTFIELHFPVLGEALPVDHAYGLYAALSRLIPALHNGQAPGLAIAPVAGTYAGGGLLSLSGQRSRLRLRLPDERIGLALPLAGKALEIAGHRVRLGVPTVRALIPAASLSARLVTVKGFTEPGPFLDAVRRQLAEAGVTAEPAIPLILAGERAGQPRRRILRIRDRRIVGFALHLTALSAADSLLLQERGLGGRRRLGCGFFSPMRG